MAFVYLTQRQGKEMINSQNVLVAPQTEQWRSVGSTKRNIAATINTQLDVTETTLRSTGQTLLIWQWYQVGETRTTSPFKVKLLEILGKLMLKKQPSVTFLLATESTPTAHTELTKAVVTLMAN